MQRVELGLGNGVLFSSQYRGVLIEGFMAIAHVVHCLFQLCSLLVQVCVICFLVCA